MFQKKNLHKWAYLFKEGRISVKDEDRPRATVGDWLRHQTIDFYAEGIRKLVHRREKRVTVLGNYVGK